MKKLFFAFLLAFCGQLNTANSLNVQPIVGDPTPSCASIRSPADSTDHLLIPLRGVFTATIEGVVCRLRLRIPEMEP